MKDSVFLSERKKQRLCTINLLKEKEKTPAKQSLNPKIAEKLQKRHKIYCHIENCSSVLLMLVVG